VRIPGRGAVFKCKPPPGLRWPHRTKKGGTIKFSTKFIVTAAQHPWAVTYRMDFEADSPEAAADLARDYWRISWEGPEVVTETLIHVHRYLPNSQEIYETPAFVVSWAKVAKKGE
jgi:hypothetical protein